MMKLCVSQPNHESGISYTEYIVSECLSRLEFELFGLII